MNKVTENRRRRGRVFAGRPAGRIALALGLLLSAVLRAQSSAMAPAVQPVVDIREAARKHVLGLLQGAGTSVVTPAPLDARLRLARCEQPLSAALPAGTGIQARVTVAVSCASPRWSIFVPVVVETTTTVLVLNHAVDRGALLTAADVVSQNRTLSGPGTAYLSATGELSGRVARRPLAAGSTLSADMFMAETVVHRGQDVTLLAGDGPIQVRAAGKALMDGAAGMRIQVQNLSSRALVEGVVESAEVVRVGL